MPGIFLCMLVNKKIVTAGFIFYIDAYEKNTLSLIIISLL